MRQASTLVINIVSVLFLVMFAMIVACILLFGMPKAAKSQNQRKMLVAEGLDSGS